MSSIPSQDTGGNQLFLPSTSNITDISLISIYWSDILGKPSFCNVAITANYNDLINLPNISNSGSSQVIFSGNYNDLSNLPWINNNSNIYFIRDGNVGIGTTNPNNKLHLIGNFSVEGNIIPTFSSNFDLGSSNFKWKDLYLSGNSIFLDNLVLSRNNSNNLEIKDNNGNFKNLNLNSVELNNLNDKVILSLSNQQLIFNSNGTIFNSINFNNYSNIIYSNVLSNTSNSIINYINSSINNIKIPNTDTIIIGTSNRFITSNTYSNNLTITSNLFINGNYYLKNQILPFSITSNTSIIASNGLFNYINNCNFGYYTFLTNGSITFPQTTNCDILVVGAGGNGGIGSLSGGGGAGEVISYPSYTFNQGTYNIKVGVNSLNSNDRISSITSNATSVLARGGGDGAYSIKISNNYPIVRNLDGSTLNPRGWYKFDIGGLLTDSSGNNFTLVNGFSMSLNTNDFVFGDASTYFDNANNFYNGFNWGINGNNFSICFWSKRINNGYMALFQYGSVEANGEIVWANYTSTNNLNFRVYGKDNTTTRSFTDAGLWVHLGFVYNATSKVISFYYNGTFIESITSINLNINVNTNNWIGLILYPSNTRFYGLMDDYRIYLSALTNEQIKVLYNYNNSAALAGGSGGGGTNSLNTNTSSGAIISNIWNTQYSFISNGSNGTIDRGGNGGSALSNIGFTSLITGTNLIVGEGGNGATSNSVPILEQTYGNGGDGNGGLGTQGIIIIRTPLDIIKSSFDGYINYSNVINRPIFNDIFATNNYINIGFNNQINFPLADVAWANEWFLYIGTSPTLVSNSFIFWHLTSTINSKWWFNGTTATTNAEISDSRIKKEITDIQNPIDKLMALNPKEYYLCDEKDYLRKYGILAQDVHSNQDLKHLVYQDEEYIANIYTNASYNNRIITTEISIIDKIEINDELKILIDNNNENKEIIIEDLPYHNRYKKRYVKVKEIINDNSFEIYEEIEIMENEKNKIFIYGKKVNDFLKLDYSSLYSLNIACTQELYKIIEEQTKIIQDLKYRINLLKK